MQTDPLSPQEVKQPEPSLAQEKQSPKRNILPALLITLLIILLVGVAAGLGFWVYTLNSNLVVTQQQLTTTQQQLTKLQSDYAKLKSDNEKLTADFNQTKSDFGKAKTDLATAQAALKKSQDQNTGLQATIDSTKKKVDILYADVNTKTTQDFLALDTLIKAAKDTEMLAQWAKFTASPTATSAAAFLVYLVGSVRDGLK